MKVPKLICGVSSNDNRLIPFAIFFPNPYVDPVCVFLPNVYKPDVNRIREMVSFEPGKEIERDVFCLVTSVAQRKNSESGHEKSNLKPSHSAARCFTTESRRLYGERYLLRSSSLKTQRTSNEKH